MKNLLKRISDASTAINLNHSVILILLAISLFEIFPAVEQARKALPADFYNYNCFEALENRPWYGQINTWFYFWLLFTPIIILSLKPECSKIQKTYTMIFVALVSYIALVLAVHMAVEIRNAPFDHVEIISSEPDPLNEYKYNCYDRSSGGANEVFALLLGWIPVSLYVGFCLLIRWIYNKRKTNNS